MERDELLRERTEELQAEARRRLGAPPSPDDLLAYQEGRLAAADRLRVEEGVAAFPEAAGLLRDLARFPDVRPDPGVAVPPDAEVDARWRDFRERRHGARPEATTRPHPAGRWLRLAAVIVASAGLGLLAGIFLVPERARINLALASLSPAGEEGSRGPGERLRIPASAGGVLLSLGYAPGGAGAPPFELTIRSAEGGIVWSRGGLTPSPGGPFLVDLPADLFEDGRYRLELAVPGAGAPAAVYDLHVEVE